MSDRVAPISGEEALELWRRAVELQDAAERAQLARAHAPAENQGLSLEQVSAAAEARASIPTSCASRSRSAASPTRIGSGATLRDHPKYHDP